MTKTSSVLDYSLQYLQYEILYYPFDRWRFKTITGAINTAKAAKCSPAPSVEAKTFSH